MSSNYPNFTRTDSLEKTNSHQWHLIKFLVEQLGGSIVLDEVEQEKIFMEDATDLRRLEVLYDDRRRLVLRVRNDQ
jgi:hypothetical protein